MTKRNEIRELAAAAMVGLLGRGGALSPAVVAADAIEHAEAVWALLPAEAVAGGAVELPGAAEGPVRKGSKAYALRARG